MCLTLRNGKHVYDKIVNETRKKENMEIRRIFLHKSLSKGRFNGNGNHSLLRRAKLHRKCCTVTPEGALTSFTVCYPYRYFAGDVKK